MNNKKSISVLLLLGILGSVLIGISEHLLHFSPERPRGEVRMLEHVPLKRITLNIFNIHF